jgi:ABC-2 type transport system permease protein
LTVVLPAMLNSFLTTAYPTPEALATTVAQRDGYHRKWDTDKAETMEKFYAHYPQFRVFPLPDKTFSWLWYYAMQQMGDDDAHHDAEDLHAKLEAREQASRRLSAFVPTLHTQLTINELCASSSQNHYQYLDSLTRFHEQKRLFFYPKIFSEADVKAENWASHTVAYFKENKRVNWWGLSLPFVLYGLILSVWAGWNLRRI